MTLAPLIYVVKPRLPVAAKGVIRPLNLGFLGEPVYWILQFGNMIQGLGVFIPSVYLPCKRPCPFIKLHTMLTLVPWVLCSLCNKHWVFSYCGDKPCVSHELCSDCRNSNIRISYRSFPNANFDACLFLRLCNIRAYSLGTSYITWIPLGFRFHVWSIHRWLYCNVHGLQSRSTKARRPCRDRSFDGQLGSWEGDRIHHQWAS